jgi:hypothetical protein
MSLSSVGRSLISSSDSAGSTLGGVSPQLAQKKAAKCFYHNEENIFHMSLSSVGRSLNSSLVAPGSILGGLNPRLALKQAAKCRSHITETISYVT